MRKFLTTLAAAGLMALASGTAMAAKAPPVPDQEWSFEGIFGGYDRAAMQRGLLVYKNVCSSCHGLGLLSYRHLEDLGYTPEEVRAFAEQYEVEDGPDEFGDMFFRPALPSDRFVYPYRNEAEGRMANGGAYPPDLSVITQARKNGPNYLYALLTGYGEPSAEFLAAWEEENGEPFQLQDGMNFNEYFPGHQIAMAQPIWPDGVDYPDGTEATVAQQARDVTHFLMWAAEPNMEARKSTGISVMLFLVVFTGLALALKRRTWADVH